MKAKEAKEKLPLVISCVVSVMCLMVRPGRPESPGVTVLKSSAWTILSNAVAAGGVIQLAFDGTVSFAGSLSVGTNTTIDASGHNVAFDGEGSFRHFVVTGGILRLVNITLANGLFRGADAPYAQAGAPAFGGSILNLNGALQLTDCRFLNNTARGGDGDPIGGSAGGAAFGGAIYSSTGSVQLSNCVFATNSCTGGTGTEDMFFYADGGGDAVGGAVCVTNSTLETIGTLFAGNLAQAGGPGFGLASIPGGSAKGGAIASSGGSNLIQRSVFSGNSAISSTTVQPWPGPEPEPSANGGALYQGGGTLGIDASTFTNNLAQGGGGSTRLLGGSRFGNGNGGGVFIEAGTVDLKNCALVANQARGGSLGQVFETAIAGNGYGGGVFNSANLTAANCTFSGNVAQGGSGDSTGVVTTGGSAYGGALFSDDSTMLVNTTFAENQANAGLTPMSSPLPPPEGLGASIFAMTGACHVANTILSCIPPQINFRGYLDDVGHNICSDGSVLFSLPTSRAFLDPQLGPIGDHGGPTPTAPLLPTSPAIDAADDSLCPATDQRGVSRPQGSACDIGAYELAPTLALTRDTNGLVTLLYAFQPGATNQASASTNLVNWTVFGTQVAGSNGAAIFQDTNAPPFKWRFYQVSPQR
jgi:hypothetical protein